MTLIVKYIIYAVIFIILLSLWGFYLAVRPFRYTSSITPQQLGVNYEDIEFHTSDNVLIKGWFVPSEKPNADTIICLHGYPADKGDILPSRLFLHKNYNLLFIDFRYLGASGGRISTVGVNETRDVLGAIAYLKTRGIHDVGVWGLSLGASTAIMTSKNGPEIKAIIAESPYARLDMMANKHYPIPGLDYLIGQMFRLWGNVFLGVDIRKVTPATDAKNITIPLLLIYSKQDNVIPIEHGYLMQKETAHNPHVKVIILDNLQHGELPENYQKIVSDFFNKNL